MSQVKEKDANINQGEATERPTMMMTEDKLHSTRTLNWTSTQAPATTVGKVLQEQLGEYSDLEKGIRVFKITSRGVQKKRVVTLSQDRYAIFVTHQSLNRGGSNNNKGVLSKVAKTLPLPLITRKGVLGFTNSADTMRERFVRYIDVADLDYVQSGLVGTQRLEWAREKNRLKGVDSTLDKRCDEIVTIGHHGDQTLDLLVPNATQRSQLVKCLKDMIATYKTVKNNVSNEALLLRYVWYDVDADQNGLIGQSEFLKILSRVNFQVRYPAKTYKEFLKKQENANKKGLSYAQVMTLLQSMKNKSGKSMANQIWDEVFSPEVNVVGAEDFLTKFLHETQGETHITDALVRDILSAINVMEINVQTEPKDIIASQQISRERFEVYLNHSLNSAYDPWSVEIDSEAALTEPISKFWVNSSHNTYLTGDQLQSKSSVEMYMRAMRRGCKCLELDCWDGEKTSSGKCFPVVFHGHTLTSKILFVDIIRGVKNYMDEFPDSYPMIVSLENHCSHPFQRQMAEDMKEILGNILYVPTDSDREGDLPSPESLRGKVVIKGKRPPEPDDAALEDNVAEKEDDPYISSTPQTPDAKADTKGGKDAKATTPPKIVKELAELTLFHGAKFKNFAKSIEEPTAHMHSIGETKITKIVTKEPSNSRMWREYNIHHMTRTYPAGKRVESSNYNPILAWGLGCQLVALNFQTTDSPLILNDGLFRQNASCGYIHKPTTVLLEAKEDDPLSPDLIERTETEDALESGIEISPTEDANDPLSFVMKTIGGAVCGTGSALTKMGKLAKAPVVGGIKATKHLRSIQSARKILAMPFRVRLRILSGSCLPKPYAAEKGEVIDPYVTVTLHDIQRHNEGILEYASTSFTTSTIQDNGFCPIWNEKEHEFMVHSPQVAMIQFELKEKDIALDDKVANAAIPVSVLRQGYRSVELFDQHATRSGPLGCATLLVEIKRCQVE